MNFFNRLITVDTTDRNFIQIILWWEIRRILYNCIVFLFGMLSLILISCFTTIQNGEDTVEPLVILAFALVCNIGYTLGWITELMTSKSNTYGPKMFKFGLFFTLIVVLIPALIIGIDKIL